MWQVCKIYKTIGTNINKKRVKWSNEGVSLHKGSIHIKQSLEQKVREFAAFLSGVKGRFVFPYAKCFK